jgi:hypothetical protein
MYDDLTGTGGVSRGFPALPSGRDLDAESREWRTNAAAVASFYDHRLVNRRDVWGAYKRPEHRTTDTPHTYTAPARAKRGAVTLDGWRVQRHVRGMSVGDVIGLHSTSVDDMSRWGAFDLDAHGPQEPAYYDALTHAAGWLAIQLDSAGAVPLVEDSNGAGGYHVWIYFDAPVPTAQVYAWLDALAERARLGSGVAVETFPKQASARGAFGNWLRLPGRHHTRAHWSRVARVHGEWQSGADAVRTLLEWSATPVAVVPPLSAWPLPCSGITADAAPNIPSERAPIIRAYLRKLPHGSAGTERSNKLFSLARFLRHGMGCTDAEALPILRAWNAGNTPPLDAAKVVTTWANSATYNTVGLTLRTGGQNAA